MRRSLAALVLLLLVVVAVYVWLERSGNAKPITAGSAGEVREDARQLGAEARQKLSEAGRELHDAKVTASVKTALSLNRSLRPYSIEASSENGVVTLTGRVSNAEERARAEEVAAAVPDVTRVVNRIQVGGGAPAGSSGRSLGERFDDEKIEVGVRLALSLNKDLRGADVTVQSYRGEVTLGGEVATEAQHQEALRIARDAASVSKVIDNVRVRAVAAGSDRPAAGRAAVGAAEARADRDW